MSAAPKKKKASKKQSRVPTKRYTQKKYTKVGSSYARKTYKNPEKMGPFTTGGELVGGHIGSSLGPGGTLIGSFLGGKLGHLVDSITGFGDYRVNGNTIMTGGMAPAQMMNTVNRGGIIIRHREYLGDINASTGFNIQALPLNPGLSGSFPWLSQLAPAYEEYRWRGLLFEFNSLSSDAVLSTATSSALGSVMMATQYNALLPAFTDKRTLENYEFANSRKPSCSFVHPVECKAEVTPHTKLYVRQGAVTVGDLRLYDIGNFYIATQGMQAASGVAGELWATYEIEFYKPKFTIENGTLMDHYQMINTTPAFPLGTTNNYQPGSNLGGTITNNQTVYNFPVNIVDGNYLMIWLMSGTVAGTIVYPGATPTNCTYINLWLGNNGFVVTPVAGATSTVMCALHYVQVTGPGAKVTWSGGSGFPTTITAPGDLMVVACPNALLTAAQRLDQRRKGTVLSFNSLGEREPAVKSILPPTPQELDEPKVEDLEELISNLPFEARMRLLAGLGGSMPQRKSL